MQGLVCNPKLTIPRSISHFFENYIKLYIKNPRIFWWHTSMSFLKTSGANDDDQRQSNSNDHPSTPSHHLYNIFQDMTQMTTFYFYDIHIVSQSENWLDWPDHFRISKKKVWFPPQNIANWQDRTADYYYIGKWCNGRVKKLRKCMSKNNVLNSIRSCTALANVAKL